MEEACRTCVYEKQINRYPSAADEDSIARYQNRVREILSDTAISAPEAVFRIKEVRRELFGETGRDFTAVKRHYNALMLSIKGRLDEEIESAADPLKMALKFAMAGNYIDFSALRDVREESLFSLLKGAEDIRLDEAVYRDFLAKLSSARRLTYVTDNCGEIVADRCLIETMLKQYPDLAVTVLVRGASEGNDATLEDAHEVGLTEVCEVIGNGSRLDGTVLSLLSGEAREALLRADLVLAKGQANYETMAELEREVYFLFLCKCRFFMEQFGVPQFTGIFTARKMM